VNILRRLPLSRLLLLCGLVLAIGVSATALAFALGSGPTPPAKSLADAVHDALGETGGESIQGVSASVTLTNHLLEGANLADGGQAGGLTSNPLIAGASGRLWIAKDGRVRLELQSEKGDTQVLYDGHTLSLYDAATNTLYHYNVPPRTGGGDDEGGAGAPAADHEVPSVARIEEAISHLGEHADVSGATPTDVAGQPAYTVRVSPKEGGSLLGGVELSFDAVHGVPLRAAIYSTASSSPVIELAADEISYGAVSDSVFAFTPPADAKVVEVASGEDPGDSSAPAAAEAGDKPKLTAHGHGLSTIVLAEGKVKPGDTGPERLEGLPQVKINGINASELTTALGTVLSFERSGVRYLVGGFLTPAAIEAFARGL
jgi:outer membrane lipoprotein-sorting protein